MDKISVDEFVATRVLPEYRPIVEKVRELIKACAPEAKEIISYGIPAYRVNKIIAVISPTKKDITLAFTRGAEFEDRYKLLRGVGKVSKNVKFKKVSQVDRDVLSYYIQQALELDGK